MTDKLAEPIQQRCYDDRLTPFGNQLVEQRMQERCRRRNKIIQKQFILNLWKQTSENIYENMRERHAELEKGLLQKVAGRVRGWVA